MPDSAGKTIVEVLYPEYANQAGDNGNAMYLRACLPDATFVETSMMTCRTLRNTCPRWFFSAACPRHSRRRPLSF